MRISGFGKQWKKASLIGMSLSLLAFTSPKINDLVEINGFLNGRKTGSFTASEQNKLYILKKGTRAIVREVKQFASGNYGLCLNLVNALDVASTEDCVWAYFDKKNPALQLFSVSDDEAKRSELLSDWSRSRQSVTLISASTPEQAAAAQVIRETTAVVEKKTKPQKSESKGVDANGVAVAAVQQIVRINQVGAQAIGSSKAEACVECSKPSLQAYPTCDSRNSYLESGIDGIINTSVFSDFFKTPQKEVIRPACIQRNMQLFSQSSSFFRQCGPQQKAGGSPVVKACMSEDYVNVTAKSFNLAAECLGDYVAGTTAGKNQAALSIFAFMAQESGMHVNARSGTGAGGPGQMTGGAIHAVNLELVSIRQHLAESKNSNCSKLLAGVLTKPMSRQAGSCDRISIHNDNPIKSMAYAFAYQAINRRILSEIIFDGDTFGGVLSSNLPPVERDRLMMELSAWAHNTGPAGMVGSSSSVGPLKALLKDYTRNGKRLNSAEDVNQFLSDLRVYMGSHAHPANRSRGRISETMNYYNNIQQKMKLITKEPKSCLAI